MNYYFVSDLHGCDVNILKNALNEKGFKPESDTLVVVGDLVDRGPQTLELLQYIMPLPHRILVRGNHDWRDFDLLFRAVQPEDWDVSNGVKETLRSLMEDPHLHGSLHYMLRQRYPAKNTDLFRSYYEQGVWAIEFSNLIVTHGWVPYMVQNNNPSELEVQSYGLMPSWRHCQVSDWIEATWAHTQRCIRHRIWPDKMLLAGHWHAWRLRDAFELHIDPRDDMTPDCRTWRYDGKGIFIDTCTNYSQQVNVEVLSFDDEDPIVYASDAYASTSDPVQPMPLSEWEASLK